MDFSTQTGFFLEKFKLFRNHVKIHKPIWANEMMRLFYSTNLCPVEKKRIAAMFNVDEIFISVWIIWCYKEYVSKTW